MNKLTIPVNESQKLRGVIHNPGADRLMILVHGFSGNMNGPDDLLLKLGERMDQEGLACLRFNFRGTPPSDGEHQDMTIASEVEDLQAVFKYVKDQGYKKVGALGESMGATILCKAYDPFLKVIAFWYPAFDLTATGMQEKLNDKQHQKELKDQGYTEMWGTKIGEKFYQERTKTTLYDDVKKITCPILFMHGDADTDVPVSQSEKAFEIANEPKELDIIEGADHCFKKEQPLVIAKTMGFLRRNFK